MDLDNVMKYQKTKSIYIVFFRILAHYFNIGKRPKIWSTKPTLAGQLRPYLVAFGWLKYARKLGLK